MPHFSEKVNFLLTDEFMAALYDYKSTTNVVYAFVLQLAGQLRQGFFFHLPRAEFGKNLKFDIEALGK